MARQPAENSKDPVRICLLWIPNWNGDKHVTSQLYPLLGMVLLLCGSACQAAQPVLLEEGLNTKCFKMAKVFAFVCSVFLEKEKDAGSKTFWLNSLCLCPIGRLIASILHTIVIFMSKEAKICNTIFSRQKENSV